MLAILVAAVSTAHSQYEPSNCLNTCEAELAQCRWDKPTEISGGAYTAIGFEIAVAGAADAAAALDLWKSALAFGDFLLGVVAAGHVTTETVGLLRSARRR